MDNDALLAAGRAADVDDQRRLDGLLILSAVLTGLSSEKQPPYLPTYAPVGHADLVID